MIFLLQILPFEGFHEFDTVANDVIVLDTNVAGLENEMMFIFLLLCSDLNPIYSMPMSHPSTRPTNNQIRLIFTFFFFKRFFLFYLHFICAFLVRAQTYPIYMYDYFSHLKLA